MAVPAAEVLRDFRCKDGDCIMGLHRGLTDEYTVEGTKLLFRGEVLGDLSEQSVADIICYEHCHQRYFDEVLGAPVERKPTFSVVSRHSKVLSPLPFEEEDDF